MSVIHADPTTVAPTTRRRLIPLALAGTLLWCALLLVAVAVVQRPAALLHLPTLLGAQLTVVDPSAAALGRIALALGSAALAAASALGLGQFALRRLHVDEGPLAAWLLGLGLLGSLSWLVAAVAVPPRWLIVTLLLLPLGVWRHEPPRWALPTISRRTRLVVGAFLLVALLRALLPDYSWDGRFYHLLVPATWLEQGRAVMWQQAPHFHFPHLLEGLFLAPLALGGDAAAKLMHWLFFPLVLALVWTLSGGATRRARAEWALMLAASIPMLALLAGWAYTDVALAAFTLASLWMLLRWRELGGRREVVAGVFGGLALGLKYIAFLVPAIGVVALLLWQRPRAARGYALGALAGGGLWYLRNLLTTGNPLYPFLWGGPGWDAGRAAAYRMEGTGIGLFTLEWLRVPWLSTLGLRDANFYDGQVGPLFLALLPLALLMLWNAPRTERGPMPLLAGAAGALVALWMAGIAESSALWQSRFLLPPLLLVVPLLAWSIERWPRYDPPWLSLSFLGRALIWLWIGTALVYGATELLALRPLPLLVGGQTEEAWLRQTLGEHYEALRALDGLPPDARLLALYEPRAYGAARPIQPDAILDEFDWRWRRAGGDPVTLATELHNEGYTHLLFFRAGSRLAAEIAPALHTPEALGALDAFLADHATVVWRSGAGAYEILALERTDEGAR